MTWQMNWLDIANCTTLMASTRASLATESSISKVIYLSHSLLCCCLYEIISTGAGVVQWCDRFFESDHMWMFNVHYVSKTSHFLLGSDFITKSCPFLAPFISLSVISLHPCTVFSSFASSPPFISQLPYLCMSTYGIPRQYVIVDRLGAFFYWTRFIWQHCTVRQYHSDLSEQSALGIRVRWLRVALF